jgi:hypothetical protein
MLGAVLGTVFLVLVLTSCLDLNETGFLNIAFWSGILVLGRIWTSPFSTRNHSATLRMNSITPSKKRTKESACDGRRGEGRQRQKRCLSARMLLHWLALLEVRLECFLLSRFSCGYPFSSFAGFLFSAIQHVSNCTSYPLISSSSSINLASL